MEDEKMMDDQTQKPISKPCPECGGERTFVKYGKVYPREEIRLVQPHSAYGFFMNTSSIDALTCLTCGYTTLYATQPDRLKPYKGKK